MAVQGLTFMDLKRKIVAAIDFGTCNTRMAFAFKPLTQQGNIDIIVMDAWENAPGHDTMAPTAILFDPQKNVQAYGFDAEESFRVLDKAEAKKSLLFKYFKMALHQKKSFSDKHKIEAVNGGHMEAMEIFSKALKYLSDKLIKFITNTTGQSRLHPSNIQWVLTVPAIWEPGARHFMRKAAYKAGLCDPASRKQLIIALEPECAALHVRSQQDQHGAFKCLNYGVVDCGGGTVDIAYHSVDSLEGGTYAVNELAPPSGGPFGGTRVDEAFEKLLEPVFGAGLRKAFFDQLKLQHPAAWLNLRKQLEERKTVLEKKKDDAKVWFDITMQFNRACVQISDKDAFDLLSKSKVAGVTLSQSDQMEVRADLIKALYHPIVNSICKCLNDDLAKPTLSEVSALYMVGSFSKSEYLLESVRRRTGRHVLPKHIINPKDSSIAIVMGAVMYGINPGIVQERVAARSYGLHALRRFDSKKHSEKKAVYYEGVKYCSRVYDEFLKFQQTIRNTDETIKRRRTPAESYQDNMCIKVYSAPHTVTYVDDPGCKHLADLVVDMPDLRGGKERKVDIEIEFDGPEIHVIATDENTGKSYDVSLEFTYE